MPDTPPVLHQESDEPEQFRLPVLAWICWGAYFAFRVVQFVMRQDAFSAEALGELIGVAVGMLLIPLMLAWILWRTTGRSAAVAGGTFFVVFALAVLGQIGQRSNRVELNRALDHIEAERVKVMAEQRAALAKGRAPDRVAAQHLATDAGAQFGQLAQNASGRERLLAGAMKTYMDEIAAAMHRYDVAIQGLHADTFWSLPKFTPGAPAEARRKAVREFARANADLGVYQDKDGTALRRIVNAAGATSSDVEQVMSGYQKGASTRLQYVIKIRETDAQLAQAMLEFIDLAEASRGKWHFDDAKGKIIFTEDAALARYNDVLRRVKEISARQAEYQRQALAAK